MSEAESLDQYIDRSDDELFAYLGADLLEQGRGLGPADDDRQRKAGKAWFTNQLGRLRRIVCKDTRVKALIDSPASDRATEAVGILEALLGSTTNFKVSPYILAVLLARIGLKQFCTIDDEDDD